MTEPVVRLAAALVCGCAILAGIACGKRGNPMPPLQRIPAAPTDLAASRYADDVYLRVTVPTTNVDGASPSDAARLEIYALTLDTDSRLLAGLQPEELRELSTLVASETIRRPLPPPPPVKEGMPPIPLPPPPPGLDQGATVVFREPLTPEARATLALPPAIASEAEPEEGDAPGYPLGTLESGPVPTRYYYAVAVSARGRYGPHTGLQAVPLAPTTGPPSAPQITVAESSMTLRWTPPVDARGVAGGPDPELLPSRSLLPAPPATTYEVYEVSRNVSDDAPLAMPSPMNEAPIPVTELTRDNSVLDGGERCFFVRPIDTIAGVPVRGPASPVECATFDDVFPPTPPLDLLAASVPGAINLIWEPSAAKDVDGYVVLRGEAGGATLTALTTVPASALRYRDDTVQSGVRYVYAIVAVDRAGNRSEESNRAEETAR